MEVGICMRGVLAGRQGRFASSGARRQEPRFEQASVGAGQRAAAELGVSHTAAAYKTWR